MDVVFSETENLKKWRFALAEIAPYSFEAKGYKLDNLRLILYGHDDSKLLEVAKAAACRPNVR